MSLNVDTEPIWTRIYQTILDKRLQWPAEKVRQRIAADILSRFDNNPPDTIEEGLQTCRAEYAECLDAMGPVLDEWRMECIADASTVVSIEDCVTDELEARKAEIAAKIAVSAVNVVLATKPGNAAESRLSLEEFRRARHIAASIFEETLLACYNSLVFLKEQDAVVEIISAVTKDMIEDEQTIRRIAEVGSVPRTQLDIDKDGIVTLDEALAFAVSREKWVEYRPVLDAYGLTHPIDVDRFSPGILRRIKEIAHRVESRLGIDRNAQGFCYAFLPAFMDAGWKSFNSGGLCFGYTEERTMPIWDEPEMTASEAFEVCEDPSRTYGSCTEKTYQIMGAVIAAGVPCDIKSVMTEYHLFPAYRTMVLDPTDIGKIGWVREVDPVATYLAMKARKDNSQRINLLRMANLLAPHVFPDTTHWEVISTRIWTAYVNEGSGAESLPELIDMLLASLDEAVTENPKAVGPFDILTNRIAMLPEAIKFDVGFACIARWPTNPYALLPLSAVMSHEIKSFAATNGGTEAKMYFDIALSAADRIKEDIDIPLLNRGLRPTGNGEAITAQAMMLLGRNSAAAESARSAIAINPDNAFARQILASVHALELRLDESEREIIKSISIAPNMQGNNFLLAQIAMLRGDLKKAAAVIDKETTIRPSDIKAHMLAVDIMNQLGNPKKTLMLLERYFPSEHASSSSEADNGVPAAFIRNFRLSQTAIAYQAMGKFDDARKLLNTLIAQEGDDAVGSQQLMNLEIQADDINAARELFAKTAEKMNNAMKHVFNALMAMLELDMQKLEKEMEAIEAIPGLGETLINQLPLGHAMLKGDFDRSRELANALLRVNPRDHAAANALAWIDIYEGRTEDARERHKSLTREFPDLFYLRAIEPSLLLREERYEEAIRVVEGLSKTSGPLPYLEISKAIALAMTGRPDEALEIGKFERKRSPNNPMGAFIMARALLAMGEAGQANELMPEIKRFQIFDNVEWPLMSRSALEKEIGAALNRSGR